jgi:hypothetical protein
MNFIAVCLTLITVELGLIAAFLVVALFQLQKTARAVEILAYRLDEEVSQVGKSLRSGWWRTLFSVVGGWWAGRRG